jgi:hypothetical protein
LQNVACDIDLYFLVYPILQLIHGWLLSASHTTSSFADFSATTSLILTGKEMRTSKMRDCVIVGTIGLVVATCFATGERYDRTTSICQCVVFAHPDFAIRCMMALDVST